jgi:tetratricopeptide (TPR) repeat protein
MRRFIIFGILIIVILIAIPIIYFVHDRSLIPPKPDWPVPAFTPDPENTPKINWLKGSGNNYFMNWVNAHKENNALVHYIKAFSSITIPESAYDTISTITEEGWYTIYPEINEVLMNNQKALEEIKIGVQMKRCKFPPAPYHLDEPILNFQVIRNLAQLIAVSGKKFENQNRYREAIQCYLDGIQFGKDIMQKDQPLVNQMIGLGVMRINLSPLLELISRKDLSETEYRQIIKQIGETENKALSIVDLVEMEHRISLSHLYQFSAIEWLDELGPITFLYKGRALRNCINYHNELMSSLTTKSYQDFMKIDWMKRVPKDQVNDIAVLNVSKMYTLQTIELCRLRLAQIDAAIQLYHREKKQWPKSLNDLKPNYLPKVPLDPFMNQPFKITQDETGMFAYSVGPDFKNDSAKVPYDPTNGTTSLGDIIK